MKTVLLLSLLAMTSLFAKDELAWVDEQVAAIKPSRSGMSKRELSHIRDPFIFLMKNRGNEGDEKKAITTKSVSSSSSSIQKAPKKEQQTTHTNQRKYGKLELEAIINKSVLLSGIWYRVGDKVNGYTITEVTRNSVLLKKKKKELLLTTRTSPNSNLKFQNK